MEKLANIIQPDIGLLTNIGEAHSEGFESIEEKLREKIRLFFKNIEKKSGSTVLHANLRHKREVHPPAPSKGGDFSHSEKLHTAVPPLKGVSSSSSPSLEKASTSSSPPLEGGRGVENTQEIQIEVPFTDDAYLENIAHCWAVMLHVPLRLELKAAVNNSTLINDSYNNDLNSLEIALDFLAQQGRNQQLTLILSDILQTNQTPDVLYARVAELVKEKQISRFIGVGKTINLSVLRGCWSRKHIAPYSKSISMPSRIISTYTAVTSSPKQRSWQWSKPPLTAVAATKWHVCSNFKMSIWC